MFDGSTYLPLTATAPPAPPGPPAPPAPAPPSEALRAGRRYRLFYGVFTDESARSAASRISRLHDLDRGLGGSRLLPERYHVTLEHVGDFSSLPRRLVDFAIKIGDRTSMKRFTAAFTYAESFRGRLGHHPYVLRGDEGVAGFQMLRMAIGGAMLGEGLDVRNTRYAAHLTLQYGKRCVGPLNVPPVSWPVRDFALVLSHLGQTRYEILKRWSLSEEALEDID